MSKLRILQVNKLYHPWIGGVESVVKDIAEGLKDKTDMRVLVCSPKGRGSQEEINGVRVTRTSSLGIKMSMPISPVFPFYVRKYAKDADIIILHDPFPLGDLAVLLAGRKVKVAVWWHSDIVRQKKMRRLIAPLIKGLLRRADAVFVSSEGNIKGSYILPQFREKCVILPFGIDTEKYLGEDTRPVLTEQLRDKNNLKVLFAARLVYYKGADVLIKAFEGIEGAELFITGSGAEEEKLRKLAEPLKDKVHFTGAYYGSDMKSAFADCDIFVLPSTEKSETFGIVQLEAMVYGKPVINTALESGVPYVSLDGETGITVPPKDVKALAEALEKLINNRELREKYGAAAAKRAAEHFDKKLMIKRVFSECEKITAKEK